MARKRNKKQPQGKSKGKISANYRYFDTPYDAASRTKDSMINFRPTLESPNSAVTDHQNETICARGTNLYRNMDLAKAAVKRLRDNVLGTKVKLQMNLDYRRIGISEEEANDLEEQIESDFDIWANSTESDVRKKHNLYYNAKLAFVCSLLSGDCFVNLLNRRRNNYNLEIQLIDGVRCSNPRSRLETKYFRRGIETDKFGKPTFAHIRKDHQSDVFIGASIEEWIKVPFWGRNTGRRRLLQVGEDEFIDQLRPVPPMAVIIDTLKQHSRYKEAEITAAVLDSYTVTDIFKSCSEQGGFGDKEGKDHKGNPTYNFGPGSYNFWDEDDDVKHHRPARPNSNFDAFLSSNAKYLGAAIGVPKEVLLQYFESSFWAARAAMLQLWKTVLHHRQILDIQFFTPIFQVWFDSYVLAGNVSIPNYRDPKVQKAWLGSIKWIGPAQGSIDQLKEVRFAEEMVKGGFSTIDEQTQKLTGGDWRKNHRQRVKENNLRREAGLVEDINRSVEGEELESDNGTD